MHLKNCLLSELAFPSHPFPRHKCAFVEKLRKEFEKMRASSTLSLNREINHSPRRFYSDLIALVCACQYLRVDQPRNNIDSILHPLSKFALRLLETEDLFKEGTLIIQLRIKLKRKRNELHYVLDEI